MKAASPLTLSLRYCLPLARLTWPPFSAVAWSICITSHLYLPGMLGQYSGLHPCLCVSPYFSGISPYCIHLAVPEVSWYCSFNLARWVYSKGARHQM